MGKVGGKNLSVYCTTSCRLAGAMQIFNLTVNAVMVEVYVNEYY